MGWRFLLVLGCMPKLVAVDFGLTSAVAQGGLKHFVGTSRERVGEAEGRFGFFDSENLER